MKNNNLTDKDWEELASVFSGEKDSVNLPQYPESDIHEASSEWKSLRNMDDGKIDVDKAWNMVSSRIREPEELNTLSKSRILRLSFLRIAAAVLILTGIGGVVIWMSRSDYRDQEQTWVSGADERNLQIDLPDGSRIFLNRNSELSCKPDFGQKNREVNLKGEAFFDIASDASKPFIIDAGKAVVEVVGTSFSVLTENSGYGVEVFVQTGKVILEDKSGDKALTLEPGFIGTITAGKSEKTLNNDPNYLAWNTGNLIYKAEKLEVVFRDLKKVYNMEIIVEDTSILEYPWHSSIDYQPKDDIIRMICLSFNLSYSKDGDVYHLSKK